MADEASQREQAITGITLANQLVLQHLLRHLFANDPEGLLKLRAVCLAEQEALFHHALTDQQQFIAQVGMDALEKVFRAATSPTWQTPPMS